MKLHTKTSTGFSGHLIEEKNEGNWENFEILHKEKIRFKRNILQGTHIFSNLDNAMNKKNEIEIVGKTYAALLGQLK